MNIAILVKEFPPNVIGGTETQTQRMARNLAEAGHDVTVYTKSYPDSPTLDEPFTLKRLPVCHYNQFVSTLTFVFSATLYLLFRSRKHDILQCMMIYPNGFVGYIVSALTGLPYFAWIRGGDYYFMKDTFGKRWMIRRVLRDTTVLVQTDRIADDVQSEFSPYDIRVLGNGVEIPKKASDGDKIIFVGRLERQKGVHLLLKAVAKLSNPEQVLIVGDGSKRDRLERLADQLNVETTFVGEVSPNTVSKYLQQGKIFVLPAIKGEGLPNAMLEAMAAGIPVVVADTGGVADGVVDGKTGYVVEPGDENELRDRLECLCSNENLREKMGTAAREQVAQRFGWNTIITEIELVYKSVVDMASSTKDFFYN
jgi:glycosyltransferase involved in cell wall biosynthesis